MDDERIERRLAAVERAVSDGAPAPAVAEAAEAVDTATERDERLDDLAERVAQLEAATQALRGYVGAVRAEDGDVADRAERALSAVSDLEARVEALEDASREPPTDERGTDAGAKPPGTPAAVERDPEWLARADERLPASDDLPSESSADEDRGLATRLAGLL